MKCFMSIAGCTNEAVGTRTLTTMGGMPLRHGPLEVAHCADHAAPPMKTWKISEIKPWVPLEYPPDFNFNFEFKDDQ